MTRTEQQAIVTLCRHFGPLSAVKDAEQVSRIVYDRTGPAGVVQLPQKGVPGARYDQGGHRTR